MNISHFAMIAVAVVVLAVEPAKAKEMNVGVCGDPPPVANETLKGEIAGKAQLLTKYLGNAELSGKVETSRSEIFSKYPDAETSRSNAYFEYQVCVLIMTDTAKSAGERLRALTEVRREFGKPLVRMVDVVIRSGKPFVDNKKFGSVAGSESTIDLKIDGVLVAHHEMDSPFGSHSVKLPVGDHTFEFVGEIYGSGQNDAVLKDNCHGTLRIDRPQALQPHVVIEQKYDIGQFVSCSLSGQL